MLLQRLEARMPLERSRRAGRGTRGRRARGALSFARCAFAEMAVQQFEHFALGRRDAGVVDELVAARRRRRRAWKRAERDQLRAPPRIRASSGIGLESR